MGPTFGKAMTWLHTWAGVVLGGLLLAIFWTGTLSVFDREIDRWMMPGTRLMSGTASVSLDRAAAVAAAVVPAQARQWRVDAPTAREPVLRLSYQDRNGNYVYRAIDPGTYRLIPDQGTEGASRFIFPFHFRLHLTWMQLGYWLVGLAAMAMLVLLVSGVVIHRKLFAEFFTFRPRRRFQRSVLDLHNLTGVLGLPFHFVITLSGLVIFIGVYFPQAHVGAYGFGEPAASYRAEAFPSYTRPKANQPGVLASLDAMVAQAEREWADARSSGVRTVRVWHPGDAHSYVELRRAYDRDITMNLDRIYFDGASGAVLHRFEAAPVLTVQRFISGLHFIQFEHWTLRWLYFLAGLAGCAMIVTGFLFWIEARRAAHARKDLAGARTVESLAVGSATGVVLATLAFFAANRLLPLAAGFAGQDRAALEIWVFFLAWAGSFVHAWRRSTVAWREQCRAICFMAVACALLNAATTGDHLLRTLSSGQWAVAGMDAMLLATVAISAWVAHRLSRKGSRQAIRRRQARQAAAGGRS